MDQFQGSGLLADELVLAFGDMATIVYRLLGLTQLGTQP
jgi:hypothetical protein